MRTCQPGDQVQVHYTKRFEDGSVRSSRTQADTPIGVTVGTDHPRLPGLGSRLVGLAEGEIVKVRVPAEAAFGVADSSRVCRADRARFPADENLAAGRQVWMRLRGGKTRRVRVVEVAGSVVVVDTNHPRCGQSVELEVELVAILTPAPEAGHWGP